VTNQSPTWMGLLTIAGGTTAVTSNIVVGVFSNANGVIQVNGGNLTITNQSDTGQLVVGQAGRGTFTQNGGVVTVDQLLVTNGTNSVFNFHLGVCSTRNPPRSATTQNISPSVTASDRQPITCSEGFTHSRMACTFATTARSAACGTINGSVPGGRRGRIHDL